MDVPALLASARIASRVVLSAMAFGLISQPVSAERIETYWRLEPVEQANPTSATYGTPFFEQRLLPVRLVRLAEPATVGNRTLPVGTFLYLVFNADRRIGYCTIKDRSAGNQARTLFIPILDQRPCLVDSDADGRFDQSFSVYDKWGGPPSVRGSINGAQPLGGSARFEEVDIHEFPVDMRMAFEFQGSRTNPASTRIRLTFNGPIAGVWEDRRGTSTPAGALFSLGNVDLQLRSLTDGQAAFELRPGPAAYISSDNHNTIYFNSLPEFLARN